MPHQVFPAVDGGGVAVGELPDGGVAVAGILGEAVHEGTVIDAKELESPVQADGVNYSLDNEHVDKEGIRDAVQQQLRA